MSGSSKAETQMGRSPVPPPSDAQLAHPPKLEAPKYLPGTLPIYILKVDGPAALAAAEAAAAAKPPPAPEGVLANVDDPASPPHRPPTSDVPGMFFAKVTGQPGGAPAPTPPAATPAPDKK